MGLSKQSAPRIEGLQDEREWKGRMRKVSKGYTTPSDRLFQDNGLLVGLTVFLDENRMITGFSTVKEENG